MVPLWQMNSVEPEWKQVNDCQNLSSGIAFSGCAKFMILFVCMVLFRNISFIFGKEFLTNVLVRLSPRIVHHWGPGCLHYRINTRPNIHTLGGYMSTNCLLILLYWSASTQTVHWIESTNKMAHPSSVRGSVKVRRKWHPCRIGYWHCVLSFQRHFTLKNRLNFPSVHLARRIRSPSEQSDVKCCTMSRPAPPSAICAWRQTYRKVLASTKHDTTFLSRGFTYWKEATTASVEQTSECHWEANKTLILLPGQVQDDVGDLRV